MKLKPLQVKAAGEHYVTAEIHRRGVYGSPFAGNVPHWDIVAMDAEHKRHHICDSRKFVSKTRVPGDRAGSADVRGRGMSVVRFCVGVRPSAAPAPSGVVTLLFIDVEGSTRRWEADADAMRAALPAHDEVLRSSIEAHDGFLFSHTGGRTSEPSRPTAAATATANRPLTPSDRPSRDTPRIDKDEWLRRPIPRKSL